MNVKPSGKTTFRSPLAAVHAAQRVGRFVVGAVPRKGEIDILRDVAAQHGTEVVAHVFCIVALAARNGTRIGNDCTAKHARRLGIGHTRHDVEVRA